MQSRFGGRELLNNDECYHRYFESLGLQKEKALECLEIIELEFEVPIGLLRPTDKLLLLFTPVPTRNPLKELFYRTREEDSESELNYQLSKRLRQHGTLNLWKDIDIETIEDLLRAWCGEVPKI